MNDYEAMFIVRPELNEEEKKELYAQLNDTITKSQGEVLSSGVWSEKRKLSYPIKKAQEGIYYLVTFKIAPGAILKLKQTFRLNENIIRALIVKVSR